jgi:hypothetical protein
MSGLSLVTAAALFWLSWLLMPGVGVTDAAEIFALVSSRRPLVLASVITQLVSAVLYVPALMGVMRDPEVGRDRWARYGAALLLVGAMGSAADAVLHLLAYAMTAPGLDRSALIPVMAFMQGPGLVLLMPLVLSFFIGGALLSVALARHGIVPRANARLHAVAVLIALAGWAWASSGSISPRFVGLAVLAAVSAAQAGVGIKVWKRRARATSGGRSWQVRFDNAR